MSTLTISSSIFITLKCNLSIIVIYLTNSFCTYFY